MAQNKVTGYVTALQQLALPRWADLPAFPLYAEQAADVVNQAFAPFAFAPVTTSDIMYWVKQKIVPEAGKKKFDRNGIGHIIVTAFFSEVYPLADVKTGIGLVSADHLPQAYDFFVLTTLNMVHRYATNFQQDVVIPGQTAAAVSAMAVPTAQLAINSVVQKAIVHHALDDLRSNPESQGQV
ncbi:DUF1836 domain-containing protein [Schleiferilactobacillus shenzhenensis]|uniref:DUF1836 domain-containing protein n=1 Tax=Schleiferilactobacillus shenzhenensis LY-73 TaxID=1231336 RepID=U4TXK7_9LACO|nr:DUF1836 domain-containing protein [Schleiferilactobacillus shenzhenensis]ERL66548.1 hypothetical protein L248_0227 [Schleiferilactobacillus shenzhenensis LY-73]